MALHDGWRQGIERIGLAGPWIMANGQQVEIRE